MAPDWREIASARKREQEKAIPSEWTFPAPSPEVLDVTGIPDTCDILTALETEITDTLDIDVILANLASKKWTSLQVTTAFLKRAIVAHQLASCFCVHLRVWRLTIAQTNCLTEIFIDRALARAREVDEYLERTGKTMGPLHGLPVSLKDQFSMKGIETIMGYVSWVGRVAEKDAVAVEALYECGAVPFIRTNVPQTLMWGETYNTVFGRTTNPYNRRLTPGGSSGGEGALIALHGSPLGVGTDIGGSVRIPSGFCNIYALRPSYGRLPYEGAANSLEGQEAILSVIGPMSSHVSALKTFAKAIIGTKPWNKDPLVVRKPWSESEYQLEEHGGPGAKLCFAVMVDNGVIRPHPPVRRAINMVAEALRDAGHTVIEWENYLHMDIYTTSGDILVADGGKDYRAVCSVSGEPLLTSMTPELDGNDFHPWDPHPDFLDEPLISLLRSEGEGALSAYELWQLHKRKRQLRKEYLDHWERTVGRTGTGRPVDAILCP
ncbi:hypothetical protein FRB99_000916 [Tulasnella sp. 403]|nr:hypothetical protein FRB99_000916 [Tulasnella sp. 403]